MQSIKTKRSKKKTLLLILIFAGMFLATSLGYAAYRNIGPFANDSAVEETINYEEPTVEQVETGNAVKQQTADSSSSSSKTSSSPNKPVGSSAKSNVSVEITNEPKNNGGTLSVKTLVQELDSSGVCKLTLSKSGQPTITKTAKTQALASTSTCQGFSVNVSNLAKGTWNLKISYSSDKSSGTVSESVTL